MQREKKNPSEVKKEKEPGGKLQSYAAARKMVKVPMGSRILTWDSQTIESSRDLAMSLSNTIFEFLEEHNEISSAESIEGGAFDRNNVGDESGDEEGTNLKNFEDNKSFWKNQHKLLHAALYRSSSIESNVRNATKVAIKEAKLAGNVCLCQRPAANGCRSCLMRGVCNCLVNAGFDAAICKTKWRSSPEIPSGEHMFLEVVDSSNLKKGEVRVIIELNFRAEFEMARASEEYSKLVSQLPEVFVGKVERLLSMIKILCMAAKQCMKEKKMHMGPWRKQKYMQAKWLRNCERVDADTPLLTAAMYSGKPPRPKAASMLTMDLLENMSGLTVVEVV